MDSGEHDLFRTAIQRRLDIENDIRNGATAPFASRNGRDTERALIVAAILYFDESACAAMQTGERLAGEGLNIEGRTSSTLATKLSFSALDTTCKTCGSSLACFG